MFIMRTSCSYCHAVTRSTSSTNEVHDLAPTRIEPAATEARQIPNSTVADTPTSSKRVQRERGPNWLPEEIDALIPAKRAIFAEEQATKDARRLMTFDTLK